MRAPAHPAALGYHCARSAVSPVVAARPVGMEEIGERRMWQRRPHEQVIERALKRWARAGDGPGTLGVGWAGGSNRGRTEQALADLGVKIVAMPLYDEDGRVAEPLARVDVLVSGGTVLNGLIYDQLACRMILRPYVGYNDIDVP